MPRKARDLSKPDKTEVVVRGVTFVLEEFPEHEAELYDDFYAEHGGQQLDLDRQMLSVRADQIPQSRVVQLLVQKLTPLEKKLAAREKVYIKTQDSKLFEEMLELAAEIDVLKERMRSSTRDFDFEKMIRLNNEVQTLNADIRKRLETIKFNFVHRLASDRGLTEMSPDEWQEGATQADKDAAVQVVNVGKRFGVRSTDSTDQSEAETTPPETTPSEEKSSATLTN